MLKLLMLKQYEKYLLSHKHYRTVPIWSLFTTYFLVGIWCVLEIGRSPGFSSTRLTAFPVSPVAFVICSELQLRDSVGFAPTSLLSQTLVWHQVLHIIQLCSYYNIHFRIV